MTPSLYTCAAGKRSSELDIAQGWGSVDNARAVLEHHWDTWITQKDFEYLASIGINTVRLPIGYWSLGPDFMAGTDFAQVASAYTGSWRRVRRAISWAAENGIGVLVDLHGAPGSQNGQSHSGVSTGRNGLFTSEENLSKTINVLAYLAQQFSSVTNVVGIQILNEPDNVPNLPAFCK
jgi:glucan 1,3-beta-glucosidase